MHAFRFLNAPIVKRLRKWKGNEDSNDDDIFVMSNDDDIC